MGGLADARLAVVCGVMWSAVMADIATDPIAGGAGWVGAGLLGLVLAWLLLRHLPDKDAQIERLIAAKDEQIREVIADKDKQADEHDARCRDNAERLVAELRFQAEKDRATFIQIADRDRDLYRRTTEQSLTILQYLADRERARASAPCANYRPVAGQEVPPCES